MHRSRTSGEPEPSAPSTGFYTSIETLKILELEGIGLGHFGCLQGAEARSFLVETLQMYDRWMDIFRQNRDKLDDIPFLIGILMAEVYSHIPEELRGLLADSLVDAVGLAAGAFK
ncbi:MAG: hypothetical protein GY866_23645 [Proteobacteria bacterium]|nr:hypothetical protein [Pseudomonadota bacterium]